MEDSLQFDSNGMLSGEPQKEKKKRKHKEILMNDPMMEIIGEKMMKKKKKLKLKEKLDKESKKKCE